MFLRKSALLAALVVGDSGSFGYAQTAPAVQAVPATPAQVVLVDQTVRVVPAAPGSAVVYANPPVVYARPPGVYSRPPVVYQPHPYYPAAVGVGVRPVGISVGGPYGVGSVVVGGGYYRPAYNYGYLRGHRS